MLMAHSAMLLWYSINSSLNALETCYAANNASHAQSHLNSQILNTSDFGML